MYVCICIYTCIYGGGSDYHGRSVGASTAAIISEFQGMMIAVEQSA